MTIVERLEKVKIVPMLVVGSVEETFALCRNLRANGLFAAEITFRTPVAADALQAASAAFPDMTFGAGTVLNVADLHRAFASGAQFAVAPGLNPAVVREAMRFNYGFAPGVCTPSECEQALELGCRLLKFFPAEAAGGVAMLKALSAAYRHTGVRFMPTGGVNAENLRSYLEIPEVAAVGGTWLADCPPETIREAAKMARGFSR